MSDWRDTLFFWKGALVLDNEAQTWSFEGTWCGIEAPVARTAFNLCPTTADFSASAANIFSVKGSIAEDSSSTSSVGFALDGGGAENGGSYLLDNGEGLAPHGDDEHALHFTLQTTEGLLSHGVSVVAKGGNEFASFVSLGWATPTAASAEALAPSIKHYDSTLARRYIGSRDPRVKMAPADLLSEVSQLERGTPWNAAVLATKWKKLAEKKKKQLEAGQTRPAKKGRTGAAPP